ncbi:unnamed protein product [Merluccius merluccius]
MKSFSFGSGNPCSRSSFSSPGEVPRQSAGMLYWEMMRLLVLLMMIFGVTCSEGDESTGPPEAGSTCEDFKVHELVVLEGEALRLLANNELSNSSEPNRFTWYRQTQLGDSQISSEEKKVHHHGPALFFLSLSLNDSGNYIARDNYEGKCRHFNIPVRNSVLIEGENEDTLRILMATEENSGLYKCLCTWTHDGKKYTSSASREVKIMGNMATDLQIINPKTTEQIVHLGFPLTINCKAYCGMNVRKNCNVQWKKNNQSVCEMENNQSVCEMEGYHQNFSSWVDSSQHSYSSATLTIYKVQTSDLHTSFRCLAYNYVETKSHTLILKPAATTAIKYLTVDLVLFFRSFLRFTKTHSDVKYALCLPFVLDGSQYDVYVVYQSQQDSKAIEEVLNQFLSQALPLVLEQKCGYRVFIHGRDDIPGEARFHLNNISRLLPSLTDSMAETLIHAFITSHLDCCNGVLSRVPNRALENRFEQVQERVKLSRRLMVVLTPGSEVNEMLDSSPISPWGMDVNWQVVLYQALVQEIRVILVQLGELGPQGYTDLSVTLQHLIRKCAPLCWREDMPGAANWKSRFWKRVRYAMPTAPRKPSFHVV